MGWSGSLFLHCSEDGGRLSASQAGGRGGNGSTVCGHQYPFDVSSLSRLQALAQGSLLARDSQCLGRVSVGVCERREKPLLVCPEQQLGSPIAFLHTLCGCSPLGIWSAKSASNEIPCCSHILQLICWERKNEGDGTVRSPGNLCEENPLVNTSIYFVCMCAYICTQS